MPEIWETKRSQTGKRNFNDYKLYLCSLDGATCVCIIIFLAIACTVILHFAYASLHFKLITLVQ